MKIFFVGLSIANPLDVLLWLLKLIIYLPAYLSHRPLLSGFLIFGAADHIFGGGWTLFFSLSTYCYLIVDKSHIG